MIPKLSVAVCLLLMVGAPASAQVLSGTLYWDPNQTQITATDGWADANSSIYYKAELIDSNTWEYTYILSVPRKEISHFIIEVSESLTEIWDFEGFGIPILGLYDPNSGNANPDLPDAIYGIKFDGGSEEITISFRTDRSPMWGDFYAKDGTDGGENVVMWNSGFTAYDLDPPVGLSLPDPNQYKDHILVPDTVGIPEPMSLALLAAGVAPLLMSRKRR